MDAQSGKIQRNENGELYLKIPAEFVKELELNEGDEIDLVPTALGVELRKAGTVTPQFWEPFSQSVSEYQRALRMIQDDDTDKNNDVSSK
ncbi:AbrB/MazE/SpoVT family DNA-binding domain-containing protein [Secundilactobacillus yichangensis]|uniref:AbrB/MazE/SpoVT family DNA-binding domain-containing protein n=1 Tax=Secundilactobacillus yichangensis TaxID=2799580 RepID=UPI001940D213|nr:AbrB/MazE/SpoVT family DNA-binding domain-containing protein [Secundilactobacillus yichangensis]